MARRSSRESLERRIASLRRSIARIEAEIARVDNKSVKNVEVRS